MNIGIKLSKDDFMYDIHSLVKSFFPDDDVSIFTDSDAEKCGAARDLLLCVDIPDYIDRKAAKDGLKRELYAMLSTYTGHSLPWGTLSGIRPTKIPMKYLEEGLSREEIRSRIRADYLASDAKIDLALEVAENERTLLADVPLGDDTFSLYLNVPFCPSICLYCTFSSSPASVWGKRMDDYLDALIREMKTGLTGRPSPTTVYIGGGTPTSLEPQQLDRLLTAVEETWDLSGCLEFTVEAGRPDSITRDKLAVLRNHGISRISVNPQTMNQRTLDLIGRRHTVEDTVRAFRLAREMGFDNINMDIILGLPGETAADVAHTVSEIERLGPDSFTVHSLAVKRASRLTKSLREAHEAGLIEDYTRYEGLSFENSEEIIGIAYDAARRMGMAPYYLYRQKNMKGGLENTGFALPGKACLYNILIMEELQEIRAFGSGASTKLLFPDGRIERRINPKDVKTYLERMAEGGGPGSAGGGAEK